MKYCSQCGNQLNDNDTFCSKCGARANNVDYVNQNTQSTSSFSDDVEKVFDDVEGELTLVVKIFLIIGCITNCLFTFLGIGLIWCIPMTISYFKKIKNHQKISMGFKVCTLLFVSLISGILMLIDEKH